MISSLKIKNLESAYQIKELKKINLALSNKNQAQKLKLENLRERDLQ